MRSRSGRLAVFVYPSLFSSPLSGVYLYGWAVIVRCYLDRADGTGSPRARPLAGDDNKRKLVLEARGEIAELAETQQHHDRHACALRGPGHRGRARRLAGESETWRDPRGAK